jgi:secreted Zn-dependent insulinase-like peptidase
MSLVLVGPHSIKNLLNMAEKYFSQIENKDVHPKVFDQPIFDLEHSFGRIFQIVPSTDIKQLSLIWIMPESFSNWRSKSP